MKHTLDPIRSAPRSAVLAGLLLGGLGFLAAGTAAAASVTELAKTYTVGTTGQTSVDSFTVAGGGTAEISLVDLLWPQALASLSFELTDAAGKVLGTITGAGDTSINLTKGGTYFALTYGQAGSTATNSLPYGTYGISVQFQPLTPVPLPPGALLLLSGLAFLTLTRRRHTKVIFAPAPAAASAAAINV